MPSIHDGAYGMAVERGLARLVTRFERLPDAFFREVELHAALSRAVFEALGSQGLLAEPHTTADGRRTRLVHRGYPPFEGGGDPHDIVLLNPHFVRNHPLDVVAHRGGRLRGENRPVPLVAAVRLRLADELGPDTLEGLEAPLRALARARRGEWAQRCYMGVFCRHWDLGEHLRGALPALEDLATAHQEVSLVVVQSYYDDAGRVFGGRYLNLWHHMVPLPPLDGT